MKVQIFKELESTFTEASDGDKLFAGLLTFLGRRFRGEDIFSILTSDIKTIFNLGTVGDAKVNKKLFRSAQLTFTSRAYSFRQEIKNLDDLVYIELNENWACTVQGYLLAMYKYKSDWMDEDQSRFRSYSSYEEKRDRLFDREEREQYFKTPDKKQNTTDRHGRPRII